MDTTSACAIVQYSAGYRCTVCAVRTVLGLGNALRPEATHAAITQRRTAHTAHSDGRIRLFPLRYCTIRLLPLPACCLPRAQGRLRPMPVAFDSNSKNTTYYRTIEYRPAPQVFCTRLPVFLYNNHARRLRLEIENYYLYLYSSTLYHRSRNG
jgi:hypothetical protein